MHRFSSGVLLAALLALPAGCRRVPSEVTGVRMKAIYAQLRPEQLGFTLSDGATTVLGTSWRPQPRRGALPSPQDLVVYLDDDAGAAGRALTCRVEARGASDEVVASGEQPVQLRLREIVTCTIDLDGHDGGTGGAPGGDAGDGSVPADAPDATTSPADGGPSAPMDGPPLDGLPVADGPAVVDAPARPLDGTPPGDAPVPVDTPADTAPPPVDGPGPDLPVVAPPAGCADGTREAFLDRPSFPGIAACAGPGGVTLSYGDAAQMAASVCAAGWHFCRAAEVGPLPATPPPGAVATGTCSWIDRELAQCSDMVTAFTQSDCQGLGQAQTLAGPTSGQCLLTLTSCQAAWKLAIQFDSWTTTSARVAGVCRNHLALQCSGGLGSENCWVTCCRDP
jgi:hypothetical protein